MILRMPSLFLLVLLLAMSLSTVSAATPRSPRLGSDWIRVSTMPDLGELAGPDPKAQHVVDHGFICDREGRWQLWACIRGTAIGRLLYGWQGESVQHTPWAGRGVVARADPAWGEKTDPESIQAPFFMKLGDTYLCFYNSNGIRLMSSPDGVNYERVRNAAGSNVLYADGGRDVMVLHTRGSYHAYSTVSIARDGQRRGYVIVRTSPDLQEWSEARIVSEGGRAGGGLVDAESPFVYEVDGYYYLFRSSSTARKTFVYRSTEPDDFGLHHDRKLIAELPIWAPEIFEEDGQLYISDIHDFQGVRVTTLTWDVDAPGPLPPAR